MKVLSFVCLLSIGLLTPSKGIIASPEKPSAEKKVIDCSLQGQQLLASSSQADGKLVEIKVFSYPSNTEVEYTGCDDFTCLLGVSGLPSGQYYANIISTRSGHTYWFTR